MKIGHVPDLGNEEAIRTSRASRSVLMVNRRKGQRFRVLPTQMIGFEFLPLLDGNRGGGVDGEMRGGGGGEAVLDHFGEVFEVTVGVDEVFGGVIVCEGVEKRPGCGERDGDVLLFHIGGEGHLTEGNAEAGVLEGAKLS